MRNSDEDPAQHDEEPHVQSAYDIADYLEDSFGIHTDRRSLYDDIEEINKILFMLQSMDEGEYYTIDEVDALFDEAKENVNSGERAPLARSFSTTVTEK